MSILTPPARRIDPRGQRFGAGVSAVVLAVAYLLALPWLAVLVGLNLAISAAFGTRFFLPGRAWPAVRRVLRLGPPAELEHEYPPRFAQALGATFIGLAASPSPWAPRRSAGSSSARWRPSRSSSPTPGSASGAASTSCAGGSRRCSPGSSGEPTSSSASRSRRPSATRTARSEGDR